ncbi:MAG: class I SAM-dependent methyltransferase [Zoogloeaceae bacterium]|nr:class I SAM-dependent methyltransferase [Zoogloeaceae bacterium]
MTTLPVVNWVEDGAPHQTGWRSEAGLAPPRRIEVVDDRLTADSAYRLASQGTAMLWRGDYQNARQLLQALGRRIGRKPRKAPPADLTEAFHQYRLGQAQRARILGSLLLPFEADHQIPLRRAPDVRPACQEAYGEGAEPYLASLRELLGLIGAHEWRKKGVPIAALGDRIHPHYGVFSPVRGEYIDLVAQAPLPVGKVAFDVGTGTGVLAAVLARRGLDQVVATDQDPRALACATDNLRRLGLAERVTVKAVHLFPEGQASLVVCNPPWLPGRPGTPLEHAVYDPDSRMLKGFLAGLVEHLVTGGEGWLILSDLAEHLGLRSRETLLSWIDAAGLRVVDRLDTRPRHPKASDADDPLFDARRREVTSLWRLAPA